MSIDLRGCRVEIQPSDHPHANESGVVIDQQPCELCSPRPEADCGYEDLIIRLDDGQETRLYEPEAFVLTR